MRGLKLPFLGPGHKTSFKTRARARDSDHFNQHFVHTSRSSVPTEFSPAFFSNHSAHLSRAFEISYFFLYSFESALALSLLRSPFRRVNTRATSSRLSRRDISQDLKLYLKMQHNESFLLFLKLRFLLGFYG